MALTVKDNMIREDHRADNNEEIQVGINADGRGYLIVKEKKKEEVKVEATKPITKKKK